jgi:hypothetical protein
VNIFKAASKLVHVGIPVIVIEQESDSGSVMVGSA